MLPQPVLLPSGSSATENKLSKSDAPGQNGRIAFSFFFSFHKKKQGNGKKWIGGVF